MDTTMRVQIYIFLTSLYGGLIAGLAYDIYRIARYFLEPKKIATTIEDFIFWIGIALIFFYTINKSDWVELRGYMFLGFFAGGYIYIKVLSKLLFPFLIKIFNVFGLIFRGIIRAISLPFKFIDIILIARIKKVIGICKTQLKEAKKYKKIISKKK